MILGQINENVLKIMNTKMKEIDLLLPDSVPPLDIAMAMARGEIQDREMDPFNIPESTFPLGSGINVKIFNGSLTGLSTIHRYSVAENSEKCQDSSFSCVQEWRHYFQL